MSLDISLINPEPIITKGTGVFVRDNGSNKELSLSEIPRYFPDTDISQFTETEYKTHEVFSISITSNLYQMCKEAGIDVVLWSPEELFNNQPVKAKDIIKPLTDGLSKLLSNRIYFEQFNPENGWGSYDGLIHTVFDYIKACQQYPDSIVETN